MASKDVLVQQLQESHKNMEQLVTERSPNANKAITVTEREALRFDRVYQEWQHTHEQLKIAILNLPLEKMGASIVFPEGRPAM